MARKPARDISLALAGTKYEGLVPDVPEDPEGLMKMRRPVAVQRVYSMSKRYGRLVSRLMRAAVEGKDPFDCIMEWQSQPPSAIPEMDTSELPAGLVSRLDEHSRAVRDQRTGRGNEFTKAMEEEARKKAGGINDSIRRAEEKHAARLRHIREMKSTAFNNATVAAGTELDRAVKGGDAPAAGGAGKGVAGDAAAQKRNKKKARKPLKEDSAYRRILDELRRTNLFSTHGLGAPELSALRMLTEADRSKYRDRVAEKLLGRARRFVRQLRRTRRRMEKSGVFGPRANAARLRSIVDVSSRSAHGAVSVQRARRDVLGEIADERAFVAALGGPERKAALEAALDEVFSDTKWEGITADGARRLKASGLHGIKMSRTRRAHAAAEHFLDKLRDRARERRARKEAEDARLQQAATATRRASAVVQALQTAMAARLAQEPAEKDMAELLGGVVTGRRGSTAGFTGRAGAAARADGDGEGYGGGEVDGEVPLGRQGRSRFQRTIDPDRRSQPRWLNSDRLDRFDRLQGRLWAQELGIVDEASAMMSSLPPELRRVIGSHLPRKPEDPGGEVLESDQQWRHSGDGLGPGSRSGSDEGAGAGVQGRGDVRSMSGAGAVVGVTVLSRSAASSPGGVSPAEQKRLMGSPWGPRDLGAGTGGFLGHVGPDDRSRFRPNRLQREAAVQLEQMQGGVADPGTGPGAGGHARARRKQGRRGSLPLDTVGRARKLSVMQSPDGGIEEVNRSARRVNSDSDDSGVDGGDGRDTPGASDLEGEGEAELEELERAARTFQPPQLLAGGAAPKREAGGEGSKGMNSGTSGSPPVGMTPMFWSPQGQPTPGHVGLEPSDPLGLTQAEGRATLPGRGRGQGREAYQGEDEEDEDDMQPVSQEELKEQEEDLMATLPPVPDPSNVYDLTRSVFRALPPIAGPRRKRAVGAIRRKMKGAHSGPGEEAALLEDYSTVVASSTMADVAEAEARGKRAAGALDSDALARGRGVSETSGGGEGKKSSSNGSESKAAARRAAKSYAPDRDGSGSGARMDITTHLGESLLGVEDLAVTGGWERLLEGNLRGPAGKVGASGLAITRAEARNFLETDEFLPLLQMKAFASGMPQSSTAETHNVLAPTFDALAQSRFKAASTIVPGRSEGGTAPGIRAVVQRTRRELKQMEREGRTKGRRVGVGGTLQALQSVRSGAEVLQRERHKAAAATAAMADRLLESKKKLSIDAGDAGADAGSDSAARKASRRASIRGVLSKAIKMSRYGSVEPSPEGSVADPSGDVGSVEGLGGDTEGPLPVAATPTRTQRSGSGARSPMGRRGTPGPMVGSKVGQHASVRARETISAMGLRRAAEGRLDTPRDVAERNRLGPRWFEHQLSMRGRRSDGLGDGGMNSEADEPSELRERSLRSVGHAMRLRVSSAGGFLEGVARRSKSPDIGDRASTPTMRGTGTGTGTGTGRHSPVRSRHQRPDSAGSKGSKTSRSSKTSRRSKDTAEPQGAPSASASSPSPKRDPQEVIAEMKRQGSYRGRLKSELEVEMDVGLDPAERAAALKRSRSSRAGPGQAGMEGDQGPTEGSAGDLQGASTAGSGVLPGPKHLEMPSGAGGRGTSSSSIEDASTSGRSLAADSLSSSASAALLGLQVSKGKGRRRRGGGGGGRKGGSRLARASASMTVLEDRRAMSGRLPLRRRTRVVVAKGNTKRMDPTRGLRSIRPPQPIEQPLTRAQRMALERKLRMEKLRKQREASGELPPSEEGPVGTDS